MPDAEACDRAFHEGRYEEIHAGADALLPFVTDPDSRLTVLWAAAWADLICRDFPAASRHGNRFLEERKQAGGVEGSRDAGVLVVMGAKELALAEDDGDVNQARLLLVGARIQYPDVEKLPWFSALFAASFADRPASFYKAYTGKYAGDEALSRERTRMEAAVPGAMERVRARLGTPGLAFPPLTVRLGDGEPTRRNAFMQTETFIVRREPVAVVTVFTEHLRAGRWNIEQYLAHEFVHALRVRVNWKSGTPAWLEEGLAHWASGEAEDDLRVLAMGHVTRDPFRPEDSLAEVLVDPDALVGEPADNQRLAGAFLFHFIERSRGVEKVRLLALRLLETGDCREAFRDVLGATPADLLEEARRDVPAWFRRSFPRWGDVASIFSLCRDGKDAEALARYEALFGEGGGDWEAMVAGVARIFALRGLRRWDEAVRDLRKLQAGPMATYAMPSLRFGELKYLREAGRWEEVARIGREALRDIVWQDGEWRAEIAKWVEEAERKVK